MRRDRSAAVEMRTGPMKGRKTGLVETKRMFEAVTSGEVISVDSEGSRQILVTASEGL